VPLPEGSPKSFPHSLICWDSCWPRRVFGYILTWQLSLHKWPDTRRVWN